ncbi:MAG: hypothetical protein H7833_06890 [Magnetococcus sp. DMHC-1]|nr:hypothetical protein [Magnetococcales bacterium]
MQPANPKQLNLTLRWSLGSAFVGLALLTLLLFGVTTHLMVRTSAKEEFRHCMYEASAIGALLVDPQLHATIRERQDETSAAYQTVRHQLKRIRNVTSNVRYIYTFRKNSAGQIVFIVDAEESPDLVSHVGDVYDKATPAMLSAFEKPYRIIVEKDFNTDQWGTFLSSYAPIFNKDGSLEAVLGVDINASKIISHEKDYLNTMYFIVVVSILIASILGLLFSKRISKPLLLLEQDMSRIQKFDLDHAFDIKSHVREINTMQSAVINMKNSLRSFKKYVPAELVAELILLRKEAVLEAEKKDLTVFFSDIAGFTTISEQLSPEVLSERLGVYFEGMTSTILQHQGTVDKFIGDAIMAFWGAPGPLPTHELNGCRAALACQRFLATMAPECSQKGYPQFVTRMGLCSGEVIVGNMGYKDRLSYTAIGDTVNLASRLESLNKYYGTRIILSETTRARVYDSMVTRFLDVVAVKGKQTGIRIHELIEEQERVSPAIRQFVERHNEGMALYLDQKWQPAARVFEHCLRENPQDQPASMLLKRCQNFAENPPPEDWNGITVMKDK